VPGWVIALVAAAALMAGFAMNEIGPERRINILSFPLLGLLVWNLVIYVLLVIRWIRRLAGGGQESGRVLPEALSRWFARMRLEGADEGEQRDRVLRGLSSFARLWARVSTPLYVRQAELMLHLAAAFLAIGVVGGMYVRGLAFEYLAGWESTFLDAPAAHRLFTIVLGPASRLSGIPLPDASRLAELNWGAGAEGENAARWIHLYAVTAALWIVGPRLLLSAWVGNTARRIRRRIYAPRADDPYFRRLLSAGRGGGEMAVVLPYGFAPDTAARERLRAFLHELWGGRLRIDFKEPVAYGAEDEFLAGAAAADAARGDYVVIWMNLAATPEDENHGALIEGLVLRAEESTNARGLLVLLDATAYRERMGEAGFENRIAERRTAWRRMLSVHGIGFAVAGAGSDELAEARRAVWQLQRAET
jgi:hypothetical protein